MTNIHAAQALSGCNTFFSHYWCRKETIDSLKAHCKRAHYQGELWKAADFASLKKVEAVQSSTPSTIQALHDFLGMINHYHQFLPTIAATLAPSTPPLRVLSLLALASVTVADEQPSNLYEPPETQPASSEYSSEEINEPAKYDFEFAVEDGYSGANFNHQEEREEDNTQGSYSVLLPDGRRQTVKYHVDGDSGYVAEITYEGEAQYYEPEESEESSEAEPTYEAPEPKHRPTYSSSRPSYSAPKPRPAYPDTSEESSESAPIYAAPEPKHRPTYSSPRPSYSAPKPKPAYQAVSEESEEEEEEKSETLYRPPSRSYGTP
ncbi:cuticle protein 8-like [Palaemon carinicauda]|uniref:cuticle protein 8-like n=1 Tax=Palaemon carinicauda TaxID=392227 RepID=UPI0035B64A21